MVCIKRNQGKNSTSAFDLKNSLLTTENCKTRPIQEELTVISRKKSNENCSYNSTAESLQVNEKSSKMKDSKSFESVARETKVIKRLLEL